jgi:hypothetical protein
MTESELIALSAIVFAESVAVYFSNADRLRNGNALAYGEDAPMNFESFTTLYAELENRGIFERGRNCSEAKGEKR